MNITLDFNINFKMGFILGVLVTLFILYFNFHKKTPVKNENKLTKIMKSSANLLTNDYLGRTSSNIHIDPNVDKDQNVNHIKNTKNELKNELKNKNINNLYINSNKRY